MLQLKIPWWAKILAKICLSRLPVPYDFWRKVEYLGRSNGPIRIFNEDIENHCRAAKFCQPARETSLELGPGDSINTAILGAAYGARVTLLDDGSFVNKNVVAYKKFANYLSDKGLPAPNLSAADDIEEILEICGAQYLTQGLKSFGKIKDNSVDLVFSQAVLEHVKKNEFQRTIEECYRVLVQEEIRLIR